jgi:hypothetical protein
VHALSKNETLHFRGIVVLIILGEERIERAF